MTKIIAAALMTAVAGASAAYAAEPMQASMSAHVEKAPVGSTVFNHVIRNGQTYRETYVVTPDHSLELTNRTEIGSHN